MLSREEVISKIKSFIAFDDRVKHIILFGSVSRDEHTENSDLDICIVINRDKTKFYKLSVYRTFEDKIFDLGFRDYDIIVLTEREFARDISFNNEVKNGIELLD